MTQLNMKHGRIHEPPEPGQYRHGFALVIYVHARRIVNGNFNGRWYVYTTDDIGAGYTLWTTNELRAYATMTEAEADKHFGGAERNPLRAAVRTNQRLAEQIRRKLMLP